MSTYSNALAGLTANSQAINVVSSNLANLNTSGYKDQKVSFEDLVNESLSGFSNAGSTSGSTIAKTQQAFTQGSLQTTNSPFDAAIQGDGFFVLHSTSGQQLFTRQGNFQVDSSGRLTTSTGQFVQGWNATNGVLNTSGASSDIKLPTNLVMQPVATTQFSVSANLNSNAAVGSASGTFSSPVQVFDSQGNPHTLTVTYTETAANAWSYKVTIPSADLTGGVGTTTTISSGSVAFDGAGHLITPAVAAGAVPLTVTGLASGASPMNITWNLYAPDGTPALTQYNQASANIANSQDGVPPGDLNSMGIGADGMIIAKFSNGTSQNIAQIAVASILNPDSMQQLDGNSFAATASTANAVIGVSSTGARGAVSGGALEGSTVDIASEFTNLLQYERGYQANSKVITTEDTIVQQTINLVTGG